VKDLKRLHDERLKVTFSDKEAEQERDIEILTGECTRVSISHCHHEIIVIAHGKVILIGWMIAIIVTKRM
jgi:hypothetical protein